MAALPSWRPPPELAASIRLRVLSLGAGVQSTTLALMAAHGAVGPTPDCAVFADTGCEPRAVYRHLSLTYGPGRAAHSGPRRLGRRHPGRPRGRGAGAMLGLNPRLHPHPAFTRTIAPPGTVVPLVGQDGQRGTVVAGTRILPASRVSAHAAASSFGLLASGAPDASLIPLVQPPSAGHARTAPQLHRQQFPGNAAAQNEQDAGQCGTVIQPWTPTLRIGWFQRDQRLDDRPQGVGNKRGCHPPSTAQNRFR